MNLVQLKAFDAVVRTGSITEAARRLFVTQPAVTSNIKTLESTYDVALLRRRGRGVEPTELGHSLAAISRELFALEDRASELLQRSRAPDRGHPSHRRRRALHRGAPGRRIPAAIPGCARIGRDCEHRARAGEACRRTMRRLDSGKHRRGRRAARGRAERVRHRRLREPRSPLGPRTAGDGAVRGDRPTPGHCARSGLDNAPAHRRGLRRSGYRARVLHRDHQPRDGQGGSRRRARHRTDFRGGAEARPAALADSALRHGPALHGARRVPPATPQACRDPRIPAYRRGDEGTRARVAETSAPGHRRPGGKRRAPTSAPVPVRTAVVAQER